MALTHEDKVAAGIDSVTRFKGWRFIDLFAGVGAFHLALTHFYAECVFASEKDKAAADVYEANWGMRPAGDITKIDVADIPPHEILCAGFPCQPFSPSGYRLGFDDTRGTLFFDVCRIAKYHQPYVLLLENVKNLDTHDGGRTLEVIKAALDEIGYVVHHKVMNAKDFYVAQNRERIYFVCIRKDIAPETFKWPPKAPFEWTMKHAIEPNIVKPMTQTYIHEKDYDESKGRRVHRVGRFGNGGQGYRIYDPRGISITLCAGGGTGSATGVYMIDGAPRTLTGRECARLQGFPKTFKLHPNDNKAQSQMGNSIPVTVLKRIVSALTRQLPPLPLLPDIAAKYDVTARR